MKCYGSKQFKIAEVINDSFPVYNELRKQCDLQIILVGAFKVFERYRLLIGYETLKAMLLIFDFATVKRDRNIESK